MIESHLITGGQRSGKSSYAQQLAESLSPTPQYIATAKIWDDDFKARVERHKKDRGDNWTTVEMEIELHTVPVSNTVSVIDCITLWLTNIFYTNDFDVERSLSQAQTIWDSLLAQSGTILVVTNELGMGVHPENEGARKFADLQGWMNQYIAKKCTQVTLMVSGIPTRIKP